MEEKKNKTNDQNDQERGEKDSEEKSNLDGDYENVAILLLLYLLQGIPLGISSAIPILLQNRGVSYAEQAVFTFAFYPFTLKILWAPIVDSVYIKAFGRRKTWLIPMQLMIGAFMVFLAQNVDDWLGDGESKQPQMLVLTTAFFFLWFLTATQDVAVDGWALTMLQRKNVGHAATCNVVGQTAGGFLGYVIFLVLESKEFANKYIYSEPQDVGLVTLSGFLQFWGIVFLGTTILIAIFKKESSEAEEELEKHPDYGIKRAYPMLWKIVKLKPVLRFAAIILTVKISFAAVDGITTLKLVEYGIPKDKIALLSIPLTPVQILLPFIISKFTTGPYPMNFFIKLFPYRLFMTIVIAVFVYYTPQMIKDGKDIPLYYYAAISVIYLIYQIPLRGMYVAEMSFVAKISDPLVGSSYTTLLTTLANIGGLWVRTFFVWLIDIITWKTCVINETASSFNATFSFNDNKCLNNLEKSACTENGGRCNIDVDGYYIEAAVNVVYGLIWYQLGRKIINYLQEVPLNDWRVLTGSQPKSERVTKPEIWREVKERY